MPEIIGNNLNIKERKKILPRLRSKMGNLALAGTLLSAPIAMVAEATPASADGPSCYGDYCTGKMATETGCDKNVITLSSTVLSKSGGSLGISLGPVELNSGEGSDEIGVVELRWSEECGTAWTKLRTNQANDISYVGIEKNDGFRLQKLINGNVPGSPAANVLTPMVYGRGDSEFRGFVFSQKLYDPIPHNSGTYWVNGENRQDD